MKATNTEGSTAPATYRGTVIGLLATESHGNGGADVVLRLLGPETASQARGELRLRDVTWWEVDAALSPSDEITVAADETRTSWTVSHWFGAVVAKASSCEFSILDDLVVFLDDASFAYLPTLHPDIVQSADEAWNDSGSDPGEGLQAVEVHAVEPDPEPEPDLESLESMGLIRAASDGWELSDDGRELLETLAIGQPEVRVSVVETDENGDAVSSPVSIGIYGGSENSFEVTADDDGSWRFARFPSEDLAARILDVTLLSAWPFVGLLPPDHAVTVHCSIVAAQEDGTITGGEAVWVQRGADLLELDFTETGEPSGELVPVEADDLAAQLIEYLDAALEAQA